ncbi:MAG: FumA C-terminus/TtdB family hydratase beta subunit [Nanoarchaeota archaeon]|nr:FumA C-terminus/TtdB family hydratase beta subunit [Nanoarchaeota archaeon]MBU1004436.1 FumA C-terminus/TtdB family hydratase beta subunit [Nanoarchaeota archaeon]MBU1946677.1 FumA C-terminus/TtdB family hydratase beta subunit [Nanoarchaeota archaeon]
MTEHHLTIPLKDEDIEKLKINDKVYLTGNIVTARDKAHLYLLKEDPNLGLKGGTIYHCGPVVKKQDGKYEIIAAGPTTSIRMDLYESDIIEKYGVKAVIGKGGMGKRTLDALQKYKAVYLSALGGAAVLLAQSIVKVKDVLKLEDFGVPEALWVLEVKDFPAIVTMDAHGGSLHENILKKSEKELKKIIGG